MPTYEVLVDGKPKRVEVSRSGEKTFMVRLDGEAFTVEVPETSLPSGKELQIKINGKVYGIVLQEVGKAKPFTVRVGETSFKVELKTTTFAPRIMPTVEQDIQVLSARAAKHKQVVSGTVTAPMTGKIISIKVKKGERVKAGQVLCILEAMKMENEITAPMAGFVREILVSEGSPVDEGDPLFVLG